MPAIILFSLAGIFAGPVFGFINPSADLGEWLRPAVSICVAVILFEGGLTLHWHELKTAASGVKRLVSVGVVLSFGLGSLTAHYLGGLSWPVALIFGAIIVVTGPTVILPMLRQAGLNRRTASYLKWEGIINDPIGALLAVLIFQYFVFSGSGDALDYVLFSLFKAIAVGLLVGGGGAYLLGKSFQRALVPEYLKAPITLGLVLVVFALSNTVQHEAGLLAVTVMGLVMGNMDLPSMDEMRRFKEYITLILVSSVFVLLTADLNPEFITSLEWRWVLVVLAVLFFVRPLTVALATLGTDMDWRDRLLVGWVAPRGVVAAAVAGAFGPELLAAGYSDADALLPMVFSVVFITVLLHGSSIGWLAKKLELSASPNGVLIVGASPWSTKLAEALSKELGLQVLMADSSWHRLRDARLSGVPVLYGEVLSDEISQSLEMNEIRTLLCTTSNDAYNALVCRQFAPLLERERVFQLPMYRDDPSKGLASPLTGLMAFSDNAQYEELWRKTFQGWKFYKTRITAEYDYARFLEDAPSDFVPIAIMNGDNSLRFCALDRAVDPKAGQTIVYYAPPRAPRIEQNGDDEAATSAG